MTGLGISEDEARFYEQEFHAGKAIVAVHAGPRAKEAAEILRRHGGYNLENRPDDEIQTKGVFSEP
jgi:hydrogenase maturation factor